MAGSDGLLLVQSQFDELIDKHGKLVTWQAAYRCSCWTISSGAPDANCKACGGIGFIYQTQVTVKALVQGLDTKKEFLPVGEWRMGDMTCSVPNLLAQYTSGPTGNILTWAANPMWTIGEWDLVTIPNSEQRTSERLTRGQAMWRRSADTLLHPAGSILNILSLLVSDSVGGSVTYYTPGVLTTDFTVSGNVVTWVPASVADYTVNGGVVSFNPNGTNAKNLATGAPYSITYTHLTTYVVYMQVPMARDQDNAHMPRKVILRLKDVGAQ